MRRPTVWIGRSLAAILGLLLLILLSVLIIQPTFNLERLRPGIETALTKKVGVAVSIADIRLRVSFWPQLYLQGVRVTALDNHGARDLGRVDSFEAQISLLPLVRKRIFIVAARIDGCEVEMQPLLTLLERNRHPDNKIADWAWVGIRQLEAVDLEVRLHNSHGDRHEIDIASLSGGVSQIEPLKLEIFGRFDDVPLEIDFTGPPIGNLLQLPGVLPVTAVVKLGELESNAQITLSKSRVLIDELTGRFAGSPFSGAMDITLAGERPSVSGNVRLERLEVGRWLPTDDARAEGSAAFTSLAELRRALSAIELPFHHLDLVDTDLDLEVTSVDGLPVEVREIVARIILDQGSLKVPMQVSLAGASALATLELEPSNSGPRWSAEVGLSGLSLDRLRDLDPALTPLEGEVSRLLLTATSQGSNLGDLLEESAIDFEVEDSRLRITDPDYQRNLELEIATLNLRRRPNEKLRLDLQGAVRDQPFYLEASSDTLLDLEPDHPWLLDLTLQSLGFESKLAATLTTGPGSTEFDTEFQVYGDSLADLSNWIGLPDEIDLPFSATGTALLHPTELTVMISDAHLGQSSFSGELRYALHDREHLQLELAFSELNTTELRALSRSVEEGEISDEAFNLDLPILPEPILLPDTDLNLSAARISRKPADLKDFVVDLEFAEGRLRPSPFSFTVGESEIRGTAQLSWHGKVPRVDIELSGDQVDVADLMDTQLVGEGLSVKAEAIELSFVSEGRTLRNLFSLDAAIELSGRGVMATMPIERIGQLDLGLDTFVANKQQDEPLTGEASGRLNGLDAQITVAAFPSATYAAGDAIPITVTTLVDEIRTELRGDLDFPLEVSRQKLQLAVTAPALDSFEPFVDFDLPEAGPVHFAGSLTPEASGFELDVEDLSVASSEVAGSLAVDTTGRRPRIEADLRARRLVPDELLVDKQEKVQAEPNGETSTAVPLHDVPNLEWLRTSDGSLTLQVDEIDWAGVMGGGGRIQLGWSDSHLTISRFELNQKDSVVDLQTDLFLRDPDMDLDFGLSLESFRYGPIAQALDPDAEEADGTLDLESGFQASGETLDDLLASGSGHFDFTLYPHAVDTRVLDLWAASLGSVLRVLNPRNESELNCLVGRFSIDQGTMQAESLLLDTSSLRAFGQGNIDLTNGTVALQLRPRPKRRTFLSLATPIRVSGPIDDPEIRVTTGGLAGTAFRIYAWVFTVYRELFRKPLPKDGSDICVPPPRRLTPSDVME